MVSGAGTNLNVGGGTGSKQKEGHNNAPEKNFWSYPRPLFGSKSTISRLVSAFVMVNKCK